MLSNLIKLVVTPIYNAIRDFTPRKIGVINGVAYRGPRLFDVTDHQPTWKPPLVNALRATLSPGQSVVFVGGGWCIAPVIAAREVGAAGHVDVYEAADQWVAQGRQTITLNDVTDRVTIHHGIVGEVVTARGPTGGADTVPPSELPDCDCLVLDCEGAERSILQNAEQLRSRTEVLVVETHTDRESPPGTVVDLLEGWRTELTPFPHRQDAVVTARPR